MTKDYPSVDHWTLLQIEGYCGLNLRYSTICDPYYYKLDGSTVPNTNYDPDAKPDPYPDHCIQEICISCLKCDHFYYTEYYENSED